MVSDQCQALNRDDIFGASAGKKMTVKEPEENEMIPSIMMESKAVKEFDPDFFIVQL
jgi:hypothetical protein